MAKLQRFLTEVEKNIGHSVPAERRTEVLSETRSHLEDRAEDLAFGGAMTEEQAETEALTAFGDARKYARNISESFYDDKPRRSICKAALWSVLLVLGLPLGYLTATGFDVLTSYPFGSPGGFYKPEKVLWTTFCVGLSFTLGLLGRKRQSFRLIGIGAVLFTLFYILIGLRFIGDNYQLTGKYINRAQAKNYLEKAMETQKDSLMKSSIITPMEEGIRVFEAQKPIPEEWRLENGNYPVPPNHLENDVSHLWLRKTPVLQNNIKTMHWKLSSYQIDSNNFEVGSLAEARLRWRTQGPTWLSVNRRFVQRLDTANRQMIEGLRADLAQPFCFRAGHDMLLANYTYPVLWVLMLLCDALGAGLGRWVHRKTWKKKKPSMPGEGAAA